MKNLLLIGTLVALGGCATYPSSPGYANRGYAQPSDPSQWRVVSVTPVAPGTGDRVAAASPNGSRVEYSSRPVTVTQPVYVPAPVYVQQPVYVPAPVYIEEPLWYPPVSLSLGFGFGRSWGRHGFGSAHVGTGWGHGYGRRGWRHR
ncbi:hypothetical protein HF313_15705 [Massilia atriviolacea]|uniref:DUF3300 domain-containing protein n=1 Tax=Massilia atriviolacea TaxID=2495579 RepID=A0A430HCP7_9BURK|nr:hypothetical protein [Massilia atriviolacea]RSZ55281.1 hypothetical protein EJB06_30290 [Massilia atriviolacea]